MSVLSYAIAALMTGVAVWRLPAVLYGDAHRRSLWTCYAGFAAALWLNSPAVKSYLNNSPVTDLSILAKHYVSILVILAICTFVVTNYGKTEGDEVSRFRSPVVLRTAIVRGTGNTKRGVVEADQDDGLVPADAEQIGRCTGRGEELTMELTSNCSDHAARSVRGGVPAMPRAHLDLRSRSRGAAAQGRLPDRPRRRVTRRRARGARTAAPRAGHRIEWTVAPRPRPALVGGRVCQGAPPRSALRRGGSGAARP